MTEPLRVTVGVEASPSGRRAVDWALALAEARPVRLTLVTVFDSMFVAPVDEEAHLDAERSRIAAVAPGIPVETRVVEGPADHVLPELAASSDLLVIGSRRRRPVRTALAGDLPRRVARRSVCPIVIVPDDWTPRDGMVLVGVADDGSSDAAVRMAAEFARDTGRELRLLHARGSAPRRDPRSAPEEALTAAARTLRGDFPDVPISAEVHEGSASTGLLARAPSAALVVIGSHRRGVVAGLLFGSVGRELLHRSTTPLCVVPSSAP